MTVIKGFKLKAEEGAMPASQLIDNVSINSFDPAFYLFHEVLLFKPKRTIIQLDRIGIWY